MPPFSSVHLPMFTFRHTVFGAAQRSIANQPGRVALFLPGAYCSLSMLSTLACPCFCVKLLYHGNSAFEPNICLSRMAVTGLELQRLLTPTCCTHPDCHRRFLPHVLSAASTASIRPGQPICADHVSRRGSPSIPHSGIAFDVFSWLVPFHSPKTSSALQVTDC